MGREGVRRISHGRKNEGSEEQKECKGYIKAAWKEKGIWKTGKRRRRRRRSTKSKGSEKSKEERNVERKGGERIEEGWEEEEE